MKMAVRVILTKEFDIEIDDSLLTKESLKEFSTDFYAVSSSLDLFKHAAYNCFDEQRGFIEGLGESIPHYDKDNMSEEPVTFQLTESMTEIEIINDDL